MKTTSSTNLIACAVIAGAFTVGFVSGPAFAEQERHVPFKFEFNFSPNELTSITQAEALLVRLERDVRRHCMGNGRMSLEERRFANECMVETMKGSIDKFGSPALAQAWNSRADG
jgi:UrcA family protein